MSVRLGWGLVGGCSGAERTAVHMKRSIFLEADSLTGGTRTAFSSVLSTMFTCTEGDDVETVSKCEGSPHRGPGRTACWDADWLPSPPKLE